MTTSSIRAFPILPILTFALLIPTAISQDQESVLLKKVCSGNITFTPESPFAKNLTCILDNLYNNTPNSHGFSKASIGQVHGMALCRGDISPDYCDYCLHDARCKITNHCNKQTAMVWFDNCQLKYSDKDFFGVIDEDKDNHIVLMNYENVNQSESIKFKESSIGLLSNLAKNATHNEYLFAGGENVFDKTKNVTIYGMAQCTRDLSGHNCRKCLDRAIKELPINSEKPIYSIGQRVVTGSCTVRYETYTFLQSYGSV